MARILVSAVSNLGWVPGGLVDTFVLGFMKALRRAGNQVLSVRCNDFSNEKIRFCKGAKDKFKLLQKVKAFSPDIIIAFNNEFPCREFVTETDCPIFLYPADGYDFFAFPDLIDKHLERYIFLYINSDHYNTITKNIKFISKDQLCPFGYATDFKARAIEQDLSLSFLGSMPSWFHHLSRYFAYSLYKQGEEANRIKQKFMEELDRFKHEPYSKFGYELPNFTLPTSRDVMGMETMVVNLLTTNKRFAVLSELTDLGLSIYGYPLAFCLAMNYNYEILRAYNYERCVTYDQVETLYNRSKIALSLPNGRVTVGCSWRGPDVLASNAVLLANFSPDIAALMRGYIDLPMYASPSEARELAGKLLADDGWRTAISEASRQMVNDKCRFEHSFKYVEEASGVSLKPNGHGSITTLTLGDRYKRIDVPGPWASASELHSKKHFFQRVQREIIKVLPYFLAKNILKNL